MRDEKEDEFSRSYSEKILKKIEDISAENSDKFKLLEGTIIYKIIKDYVRQMK